MNRPHNIRRTALAAGAALLIALPRVSGDATTEEIKTLREQIAALDQKLKVLERKQEIKEEESAAAAKNAAKVSATDKGFSIGSADGANTLRLRALIQGDARLFINDGGIGNNDALVLRRARLGAEGVFNKLFEYQFVTEFAGSSTSVLDANINLVFDKKLQLRAGKFKSPVGLEQLQSDAWAFFTERASPSQLVGNRDIGLYLHGELADGKVAWGAGVFNGVADAASTTNTDGDDDKEFAARLFFTPFRNDKESALKGLGFGIAGSTTDGSGTGGLPSGYRTDGQQTFFRYRSTSVADGDQWRVSPQAYLYRGPVGVLGEYVVSTVNPRVGASGATAEVKNTAWQLAVGYVLTGEDASYRGVVPRTNFDPKAKTWGAFEITLRVADLNIDEAAFPLFADPAASAAEALAYGVGLNWYLSKTVRATFNYFQTDFSAAPGAPAVPTNAVLRQDEKVFVSRLQLTF